MVMKQVWSMREPRPFVAPEKSTPVLRCDDGTVKVLYIEPGESATPHTHDGEFDVMVIWEGNGIATVDGKEQRVGPGDIIMNPSGTVHGIENDSDRRLVWAVVQSPPTN